MEKTNKGTYTQARKETLERYRQNHRDKVNSYSNDWYKKKMQSDPEFVEKKRQYAMQQYQKKKQQMAEAGIVRELKKRGRKPKYFTNQEEPVPSP